MKPGQCQLIEPARKHGAEKPFRAVFGQGSTPVPARLASETQSGRRLPLIVGAAIWSRQSTTGVKGGGRVEGVAGAVRSRNRFEKLEIGRKRPSGRRAIFLEHCAHGLAQNLAQFGRTRADDVARHDRTRRTPAPAAQGPSRHGRNPRPKVALHPESHTLNLRAAEFRMGGGPFFPRIRILPACRFRGIFFPQNPRNPGPIIKRETSSDSSVRTLPLERSGLEQFFSPPRCIGAATTRITAPHPSNARLSIII